MTISTTARFNTLDNGMQSELIADLVQLFYDPTTQKARIIFSGLPYVNFGTAEIPVYHALGNNHDILHVDLADKMLECYGSGIDPVTGADLAKVSNEGLMIIIKQFYDRSINQRADDLAAAIALAKQQAADAEALVTATNLFNGATPSPDANGTTSSFTVAINGRIVTFTDTSTVASGNTITQRSWIMGDGIGSSLATSLNYIYMAAGTYTVSLVITDSTSATVYSTQTITIT